VRKYALEKSGEVDGFREIETVAAGTSSPGRYAFTDTDPYVGLNQYRVKAVFSDGSIRYSETESIRMMDPDREMTIYPNPVRGKLVIWVNADDDGPRGVRILDSEGRLVWERQGLKPLRQRIQIDTEALPAGVYHLNLTDTAGRTITSSFLRD
jgi:hypothetical protein